MFLWRPKQKWVDQSGFVLLSVYILGPSQIFLDCDIMFINKYLRVFPCSLDYVLDLCLELNQSLPHNSYQTKIWPKTELFPTWPKDFQYFVIGRGSLLVHFVT